MTDDQDSDQAPIDPLDPMGSEMVSESDLDDVLSQASSLAAELSEEIGVDAGSPAPAAASIDDDTADVSVEVGLEELERLVAATREEVDGDAPAADPPNSEPEDLAVPDFMSEFTEPEPPSSDEPEAPGEPDAAEESPPLPAFDEPIPTTTTASNDAQIVSDPSLGIVATGTVKKEAPPEPLGVVGTPSPEVVEDPASPEADDSEGEASEEPTVSKRAALVQTVVGKAGPLLFMVCDRGVSLLEKIDRPIQRLGQQPRRLIGWLAIATLGTSLLAFIVSVF